ncbi:hypothetical protein [Methylotenera sp.]|uniref:hypothetical protein n=1 Tax=Methylotenera sp. TaxID=2051956 RepID=UPI00273655B7|nr:hypothetical protein [Methylotenera sp.]MDP3211943.1 hypothetical protein [Methylotenera sp.]
MSRSLLLYSHDFQVSAKKLFKADDEHMLYINAEMMNNATHKNYKLMSELVKCLFEGYDKLTLITNFVPSNDQERFWCKHTMGLTLKTNDINETYALSDFHSALMARLTGHRLLVESQVFLKKELVNSQLSKATSNIKRLNTLMSNYDALISQSKLLLDAYREDIYLRFGVKQHL